MFSDLFLKWVPGEIFGLLFRTPTECLLNMQWLGEETAQAKKMLALQV